MKKIVIGSIVFLAVIGAIILGCAENNSLDNFKTCFGFYPSGTKYAFWTGDPNPKLKGHEQYLISEIWDREYERLQEAHKEMMDAKSDEYGRLRNSFLNRFDAFHDKINLAHHFGYWIVPTDLDGLLKEK